MNISVALCTYNGELHLAEQLTSIFEQTYPVFEIIICDDCSTDQTISLINEFRIQHKNIIKLHVNGYNIGGKKNFEKAFSLTTGDIIFFSDQDDTWEKNKVELMVKELLNKPDCLGVFSDAFLIDEQGQRFSYTFLDSLAFDQNEREALKDEEISKYIVDYSNIVAGSMLAVKKECKQLVLPFQMMENVWHDEWIALVLSSMNRLHFVNQTFINYRQHTGQQLGAGNDRFKRMIQSYKLYKVLDNQLNNPLGYFNYSWEAYFKLKAYSRALPMLNEFEPSFQKRAHHAKNVLLQSQNFIKRFALKCKWFINKEFETSLKELFKSNYL